MISRNGPACGCVVLCFTGLLTAPSAMALDASADAQTQGDTAAGAEDPSQHSHMNMDMSNGWQFMQDGVIFGMFNHQGGPRGGDEFKAPNWWMGMLTRKVRSSQLTLNAMLSLDPATVGTAGYHEIFQAGETLNGRPLIDRQHPHDLFMQLAAVWRTPITSATGLTIAGGPAGEAALGPVAFMHRASIADYPFAALSHHTFDSTHISYGVITAAIDHGPWVVEGSVFNGREPDQHRWDFDFGRFDSVAARLWYRPTPAWELQVSTGHLVQPEALEPGNVQRTTASGSWIARNSGDFTAVTAGYGVNAGNQLHRHAVFGEVTRRVGDNSVFGRLEALQVETHLLIDDVVSQSEFDAAQTSVVGAFTLGGVRDVMEWEGSEWGLGAAVTFYAVPEALTVTHGRHPLSFQVYLRIRPPAGRMGRMLNMRMSQPMMGR